MGGKDRWRGIKCHGIKTCALYGEQTNFENFVVDALSEISVKKKMLNSTLPVLKTSLNRPKEFFQFFPSLYLSKRIGVRLIYIYPVTYLK